MILSGNLSAGSHSGQEGEIRMALIVVQDMTTATLQVGHVSLSLASTVLVRMLVQQVATSANYVNGTFLLHLQPANPDSSAVSIPAYSRISIQISVGFFKFFRCS
jgi:hypothetical protein